MEVCCQSWFANSEGQQVIECLWDVSKAFDRALHHKLVEPADKQNYPLKIMRLSLLSYIFERRIVFDNLVGKALRPTRGIGPGSAFAVHELAIIMHPAVVAVGAWPNVVLNIQVDDVSLNSTGKNNTDAQAALIQAGACVVDIVEQSGGLPFSADKAQLISNDDELARVTAVLMGIRHGTVEQSVRKLGYDNPLKARGVHLRPTRGNVVRQRVKNHFVRFCRLRKLASLEHKPIKVFTAGALPAVLFGAEVWGVSAAFKNKLRVQAFQAMGLGVRGTNTAVHWALLQPGSDPLLKASWLPLERYHREVWLSDETYAAPIGPEDLARSWTISKTNKTGPSYQSISPATEAGWKFVCFDNITTLNGTVIELKAILPTGLKPHYQADFRSVQWKAYTETVLSNNTAGQSSTAQFWSGFNGGHEDLVH